MNIQLLNWHIWLLSFGVFSGGVAFLLREMRIYRKETERDYWKGFDAGLPLLRETRVERSSPEAPG